LGRTLGKRKNSNKSTPSKIVTKKREFKDQQKKSKKNPALVALRKESTKKIVAFLEQHKNELVTVKQINGELF